MPGSSPCRPRTGSPVCTSPARVWRTRAEFERLTRYLLADRCEDSPRPAAWVPVTALWIVEGESYLGRVSLRHRLTEHLLTWGGHIGYGVRPRRGAVAPRPSHWARSSPSRRRAASTRRW